jgi:putative intracellular protease/amidase
MSNELVGKRIAFLVANAGVEHAELTAPWQAVKEAGARVDLRGPASASSSRPMPPQSSPMHGTWHSSWPRHCWP